MYKSADSTPFRSRDIDVVTHDVVSVQGVKTVVSSAAPVTADNTKGSWNPGDEWRVPGVAGACHIYLFGTDSAWHLVA